MIAKLSLVPFLRYCAILDPYSLSFYGKSFYKGIVWKPALRKSLLKVATCFKPKRVITANDTESVKDKPLQSFKKYSQAFASSVLEVISEPYHILLLRPIPDLIGESGEVTVRLRSPYTLSDSRRVTLK